MTSLEIVNLNSSEKENLSEYINDVGYYDMPNIHPKEAPDGFLIQCRVEYLWFGRVKHGHEKP